ncbi:MAG: tyrosine-protein phosphatase [Casimicrobium sp.]
MIDLHCHLLPGIDDGAPDLETSVAMARIAVDDGIKTIFCTPHIYPGLYENNGEDIKRRVAQLQLVLRERGIDLDLSYGADAHLVPALLDDIRSGKVPTLGGSRYVLVEPSHHVRPPRFREAVFAVTVAGYVPVITHPERLTWIADHYDDFVSIARSGAWLQVTAGALIGRFGRTAQYFSEKFLDEGYVAVLASDAHTVNKRAPQMAEARVVAANLVGAAEADRLVVDRPRLVVENRPASEIAPPPALGTKTSDNPRTIKGIFSGLFGRRAP